MRLDVYLHEKLGLQSRNKASETIKAGEVLVNSKIISKPSFEISEDDFVEVVSENLFVSRAAYKLMRFLKSYELKIEDRNCLDIGSSTGGFAQILIQNGAKSVTCVDVGSDQLHKTLRTNPKIKLFEKQDIRKFESEQKFDLCVCDVSFISVLKILEDIDRLSSADILILFKPQFEVGIEAKRDKNGVVTDQNAIAKSKALFFEACSKLGWKLVVNLESEISGKEGNTEEFYYFEK